MLALSRHLAVPQPGLAPGRAMGQKLYYQLLLKYKDRYSKLELGVKSLVA